MTRTGNTFTLYWNGVPIGSTTIALNLNTSASLKLGHRGNPTDTSGSVDTRGMYLKGFIDEVEIFNRSLNASELQSIFNAGSYGKCKGNQCAYFDFLSNTLHIPCLDLGITSYWLDLGLVSYSPITLELKNFGENSYPGYSLECATFDFLINNLHIPCFNFEDITYWLDLGLVSYEPILLELKDFGEVKKNSYP